MSELSRQVSAFRKEHISNKPVSVGRASLFLTASEAAGVDFEEVYQACMNGISTLSQYDHRFEQWNSNVLHPSSISLQRELQTNEQNKTLNKQIHALLRLLSLYANEQASHKVLEYLLQRYRINELNVDTLLSSMLCIHDTKIFARLVQLCPPQENTTWSFLNNVRKTGEPIERSQIVKLLNKGDTALLATMMSALQTSVKLAGTNGVGQDSRTVSGVDRIISFQTALLLDWLASSRPLSDEQLRALLPYLLEGLQSYEKALSSIKDCNGNITEYTGRLHVAKQWCRSCTMSTALLARSATGPRLSRPLLRTLLGALAKAFISLSSHALRLSATGNGGHSNSSSSNNNKVISVTGLHSDALEIVMTIAILMQQVQALHGNKVAKVDANLLNVLFSGTGLLARSGGSSAEAIEFKTLPGSASKGNSSNGSNGSGDAADGGRSRSSSNADRRGSIFPELPLQEQTSLEEEAIDSYSPKNTPPFLLAIEALTIAFHDGIIDLVTSIAVSLGHLLLTASFRPNEETTVANNHHLSANKLGNILMTLVAGGHLSDNALKNLVNMVLRAGATVDLPSMDNNDSDNDNESSSSSTKGNSNSKNKGEGEGKGVRKNGMSMSTELTHATKPAAATDKLFALIKALVQRHPTVFDAAVDVSLKENSIEEQARLRAFLGKVFMDSQPYNTPMDGTIGGTSLLNSLQHSSHIVRVAALEKFSISVSIRDIETMDGSYGNDENSASDADNDDAVGRAARAGAKVVKAAAAAVAEAAGITLQNASNADDMAVTHVNRRVNSHVQDDLLGIVDAAARLLLDPDVEVALAAWQPQVLDRICSYSDPLVVARITVQAVKFWSQQLNLDPSGAVGIQAANVLQSLLACISNSELTARTVAQSRYVVKRPLGFNHSLKITDWLYITLTGLACGALTEGETISTSVLAIDQAEAVRSAALDAAYACAQYVALLSPLHESNSGKRNGSGRGRSASSAKKGKTDVIAIKSSDSDSNRSAQLAALLVQAVISDDSQIVSMAAFTKGLQATESLRAIGECCRAALNVSLAGSVADASELFSRRFGIRLATHFIRLLYGKCSLLFESHNDHSSSPNKSPSKPSDRRQTLSNGGTHIAAGNALYSCLPVLCPLLLVSAEVHSFASEASEKLLSILNMACENHLYIDPEYESTAIPSLNNCNAIQWLQCEPFAEAAFDGTAADGNSHMDKENNTGGDIDMDMEGEDDTNSVNSEVVEELKEAQASADKKNLGTRLLCSLLQTSQEGMIVLLGPCLKTFFPKNAALALVHAYMCPSGCAMSNQGRAGALAALTAFAGSDSILPQSFVLIAQFLATTAICDTSALIRRAGLALFSRLHNLHDVSTSASGAADSKLQLIFSSSSSLSSSSSTSGSTHVASDTVALCEVLLAMSSAILMDSEAAIAAIGARVFSNNNTAAATQQILYISALAGVYGGTRGSELASIVLHAATAASLENTWRYMYYMSVQLCGSNNDGHDEDEEEDEISSSTAHLLEAILRCIDTVARQNTSLTIQKNVCEWAKTLLSSTHISVASKFMRHALIVRIGNKGWAQFTESMNNEQSESFRQNLFDSLLKEQSMRPGQEVVINALKALPLPLASLQPIISSIVTSFITAYDSLTNTTNSSNCNIDINNSNNDEDDDAIEIDYTESRLSASGLAVPIQQMTSALEALSYPLMSASAASSNPNACTCAALGCMLTDLLQAFHCICHKVTNAVLSVEYSKCLLMDMARACIDVGGVSILSSSRAASAIASKGKSSAAAAKNSSGYHGSARLLNDVNLVLTCTSTAVSAQVQRVALNLLRSLLTLDTNAAANSNAVSEENKNSLATHCIYTLGKLLACTASGAALSKEINNSSSTSGGILSDILSLLIHVSSTTTGAASHPQLIIQPLCVCLQDLQSHRRGALVQMAVRALGASMSLPSAVGVLLAHTITAYEIEAEGGNEHKQSTPAGSTHANNGGNAQDAGYILLSKAASKKNEQLVRSSAPEDMFRTALDITLCQRADAQISTLVASTKAAQGFLSILAGEISSCTDNDNSSSSSSSSNNVVDVNLLHKYRAEAAFKNVRATAANFEQVSVTAATAKNKKASDKKKTTNANTKDNGKHSITEESNEQSRGAAAAMVLLQLEYVYDVVESRIFHRALVTLLDSESESYGENKGQSRKLTQELFLELFDYILQLITAASLLIGDTTDKENDKTHEEEMLYIRLGNQELPLLLSVFARTVDTWCLDILRSLHRLLDAASVVSILHELLEHEHANVRKTALHILSQRLERLSNSGHGLKGGPSGEEALLLLDLGIQLRKNTEEILEFTGIEQPLGLLNMPSAEIANRAELAQSSLMCLDALARALGGDRAWSAPLMQALQATTHIANTLQTSLSQSSAMNINSNSSTGKKTKASRSRAGSVNSAEVDMDNIGITTATRSSLLKLLASLFLCSGTIVRAGSVGPKALPYLASLVNCILSAIDAQATAIDHDAHVSRARTLLLRSSLTGLTSIVGAVPTFFHPHIERTLNTCIGLDIPFPGANRSILGKSSSSSSSKSPLLANMNLAEHAALSADIDQCVNAIALGVPARLAIPAVVKSIPALLARGHGTALRTARFLGQIWAHLDREAILAHMTGIQDVSTCLLDYRRTYCSNIGATEESDATAASAVEDSACDAIVSLCLKLTEVELRSLLGRFSEWKESRDKIEDEDENKATVATKRGKAKKLSRKNSKNGNKEDESSDDGNSSDDDDIVDDVSSGAALISKSQFARRTSFYALLGSLGDKLQSIFTPCLVPFWDNGVETLQTMHQMVPVVNKLKKHVNGNNSNSKANDDSTSNEDSESEIEDRTSKRSKKVITAAAKNKKRKAATLASHASHVKRSDNKSLQFRRAEVSELLMTCAAVMDTIRIGCTHDTSSTVNEDRYGEMMPAVTDLLTDALPFFSLLHVHDNQEANTAYHAYVNDHIAPCLTALALCVGRDVLWKPLVHKILMSTREHSSAVRLSGVQVLHKLFVDLGEELLILLPECLPYLSELLEDDAANVVDASSGAIRFIEELSGEKLDDYLK